MTGVAHRALCECGQGERVSKGKGCAECEAKDRTRYRYERDIWKLRRQIAHHADPVSLSDLADQTGLTVQRTRHAMSDLILYGEVEPVYAGTATEYRRRRP